MTNDPTRVEAVFLEALASRTSADRVAFLNEACADEPALRERVERLLRCHAEAGAFLEPPLLELIPPRAFWEAAAAADQASLAEPPEGAAPRNDGLHLGFLGPPRGGDDIGVLGPFEIIEVIGYGGTGVVLKANDPVLRRRVAVKVLLPIWASHATARQRFLQEARAAAAVRHQHVVTIHTVGEANDLPYLVMELIDGQSLQQRIDRGGPLPLEEILRIGQQTAAGLEAAHRQRLIHRDVKPANILLEKGTHRVYITDFGLAQAVDDLDTSGGVVAGTPGYMSPEQLQGEGIDHRSDLFSLGCVLYAMCTGRAPFVGKSLAAILEQVRHDRPRPISKARPGLPRSLAQIIDRLLQKDPIRRVQTAAEVMALLEQLRLPAQKQPAPNDAKRSGGDTGLELDSQRSQATGRADPGATTVTADRVQISTPGATDAGADRRILTRRALIGSIATLVAVGGGAALLVLRDRQRRPMGVEAPAHPPDDPLTSWVEIRQMTAPDRLTAMAVSPDGAVVYAACADRIVYAWDVETGEPRCRFVKHKNPVNDLAASPDGARVASVGGDRMLRIWNAGSAVEEARRYFALPVWRLAYSPDGRTLLCVLFGGRNAEALAKDSPGVRLEPDGLHLFDGKTGEHIRALDAGRPGAFYWSVAWSPDGKLLAAGTFDGFILVLDALTGERLHALRVLQGPVHALAFSRDGECLFSGENSGAICCWDVATGGRLLVRRVQIGGGVVDLALSSDSTWLLAATGLEVVVWDTTAKGDAAVIKLTGHTSPVSRVALLPGEQRAVSCAWDGTVRVWKLPPLPRRQ